MDTLTELFSTSAAQRVGWALIHFLWQGTAVALLLAVALGLLRNRSAQARWVLSCAALALMAVLPVATGLMVSVESAGRQGSAPATGTADAIPTPPSKLADPAMGSVSFPPPGLARDPGAVRAMPPAARPAGPVHDGQPAAVSWPRQLRGAIQPALPWAILAWLSGVTLMSVWHLGGWLAVRRMKRLGTRPVAPAILEVLARLLPRLRIRRPVRLLESVRVAVPLVLGWLRPVILLPVGAVTGLTPEQLEAILAHELAHIRRWDSLVLALQAVIETLLFYHPAVWRVSRRIRQESEQCCDDLAVGICGDRRGYADALAKVAEFGARGPVLAAGSTGGKLLPRIRRLLGVEMPGALPLGRCLSGPLTLVMLVAIAIAVGVSYAVAQPAIPKDLIPPDLADLAPELRIEIESLRSALAEDRGHAAVRLGGMGAKAAPAAPFLAGLLGDDAEFLRRTIMDGHYERMPSRVRTEVIEALGRISDPAAPAVLAVLKSENPKVRQGAAEALSSIGGKGVVEALIVALKDPDAAVRATAAKSLRGRDDSAAAVKPLIAGLKDASPEVRKSAAGTLGHIKDARAVPALLVAAKDSDGGVRAEAVGALGWINDPRALEPLLAGLADPDPKARYMAACMVRQFKDERVAPALAALLRDDDHLVRLAAAGVLGNLQDSRSVEPLLAILQDPKAADRWAAAEALGKLKDRRAVGPLIAALEREDNNVARYAAAALGEIGDRAAVEPLVAALKARGALVRGWVAEALGNLADERAVGPLVAALKDTDESTRYYAAWALGRMRSRAAVEPLIELLEREPKESREDRLEGGGGPSLQVVAAEALMKITGKGFCRDAAKWRAWLKENPR